MTQRRVHVLVEGRVQGVFFRAYTRDKAEELRLNGWVRNLADGRVEACIEGAATAVEEMLQWFGRGSPHSLVTGILQHELALSNESAPFTIRPTSVYPMTLPLDHP